MFDSGGKTVPTASTAMPTTLIKTEPGLVTATAVADTSALDGTIVSIKVFSYTYALCSNSSGSGGSSSNSSSSNLH